MMVLVIPALVFIAVVLLVYHSWPQAGEAAVDKRLKGEIVTAEEKGKSKKKLSERLDVYVRLLGDRLTKFNWPLLGKMQENIQQRLDMAGMRKSRPIDLVARKVFFAIGLPFLMMLLFDVESSFMLLALAGLGFYLPSQLLKGKISKRHRVILRSLPDALDLLTLSIEAGLDFGAALSKFIEKGDSGPLRDELFIMTQEIRMGKIRADALRDMAKRVNQQELSTVISSLVQAEQMGTSLGPVIRIQSEDMRIKRFQLAEKIAAQAPTKMLFPLLFFIFPSTFIVLFGPIALSFMGGGGF